MEEETILDAIQTVANDYQPFLLNVVQAAALLVVGIWIARFVRNLISRKVLASDRLDDTFGVFLSYIAYNLILVFVLIAILQLFGFQATSLVAMLGAATLAIGLALQGTLSHFAAGVMLVLYRPYKLGDYVTIGGQSGTVREINIFFTRLATIDNVLVIVPNGEAWGSTITNYSHYPTRRLDITFGIDYGDDVDKAIKIILDEVAKDDRAKDDPAPWAKMIELGESSVDIQLRVWSNASDLWDLKLTLLKNIKQAFDRQGITIPYPHQVEIHKKAA